MLKILIEGYIERSKNILDNLQTIYTTKKNNYDNAILNNYKFSWIKDLGWNIINNVEFQVGGVIIDRQYSTWLHLWNQLFESNLKQPDYDYFFSKNQMLILMIILKKIVYIFIFLLNFF